MRLSLPFLKTTSSKQQSYYLTLLLQDEKIVASILEEKNGSLALFSVAESILPTPLEDASFEDILNACDRAISQAEQELTEKIPNYKNQKTKKKVEG